jgi:hypothetical protein
MLNFNICKIEGSEQMGLNSDGEMSTRLSEEAGCLQAMTGHAFYIYRPHKTIYI